MARVGGTDWSLLIVVAGRRDDHQIALGHDKQPLARARSISLASFSSSLAMDLSVA